VSEEKKKNILDEAELMLKKKIKKKHAPRAEVACFSSSFFLS
jgi:hypothetical protein